MSEQAVMEAIGEPLAREAGGDGSEVWFYTRTAASNSYGIREVQFDPTGSAREIRRELFVD